MDYKLSKEPPPVYEKARELWGVDFDHNIVFTYGDTIHSKHPLSADVIAHELVHVRQQMALGKERWWEEYFTNPTFRFEQELEAYRQQYKWVLANVKDRNQKAQYLRFYSHCLSGAMYGNLSNSNEAVQLIKNDA